MSDSFYIGLGIILAVAIAAIAAVLVIDTGREDAPLRKCVQDASYTREMTPAEYFQAIDSCLSA